MLSTWGKTRKFYKGFLSFVDVFIIATATLYESIFFFKFHVESILIFMCYVFYWNEQGWIVFTQNILESDSYMVYMAT